MVVVQVTVILLIIIDGAIAYQFNNTLTGVITSFLLAAIIQKLTGLHTATLT